MGTHESKYSIRSSRVVSIHGDPGLLFLGMAGGEPSTYTSELPNHGCGQGKNRKQGAKSLHTAKHFRASCRTGTLAMHLGSLKFCAAECPKSRSSSRHGD